jgi:hypothetical protein
MWTTPINTWGLTTFFAPHSTVVERLRGEKGCLSPTLSQTRVAAS